MRSRELDSMSLMGPFQLKVFYDSMIYRELEPDGCTAKHMENRQDHCTQRLVVSGTTPQWQPVTNNVPQGFFAGFAAFCQHLSCTGEPRTGHSKQT